VDWIGSPDPASKQTPDFSPETPMPDHRLPQEIIDYILDLLREESKTLKQCCLVSRLWVPRARTHLFHRIDFHWTQSYGFDRWKIAFPVPKNSPGSLVHTLRFWDPQGISDLLDEGDWIQSFSRVVRLEIRTCKNYTCCMASHHFSNLSAQSAEWRRFLCFSS